MKLKIFAIAFCLGGLLLHQRVDAAPINPHMVVPLIALSDYLELAINVSVGAGEGSMLIDTGATDSFPPKNFLVKEALADRAVLIGLRPYELANGTIVHAPLYRVKKVQIGDCAVYNVLVGGSTLATGAIGMSLLNKIGPWSFEYGPNPKFHFTCPVDSVAPVAS